MIEKFNELKKPETQQKMREYLFNYMNEHNLGIYTVADFVGLNAATLYRFIFKTTKSPFYKSLWLIDKFISNPNNDPLAMIAAQSESEIKRGK